MTKFHINKHGVPALCHAKKGNCPLGGDSGSDNHFNTAEEAQAHVDQENSSQYGLLGGNNTIDRSEKVSIKIDDDTENEVFNQSSVTHSDFILSNDVSGGNVESVLNQMPEDYQKVAREGNGFQMVHERNLEGYINDNILSDSPDNPEINEELKDYFNTEIGPSLEKHYPGSVSKDEDNNYTINDYDLIGKIGSHSAKKLKDESNVKVNGKKVVVELDTDKHDESHKLHFVNFVEDYAKDNKK